MNVVFTVARAMSSCDFAMAKTSAGAWDISEPSLRVGSVCRSSANAWAVCCCCCCCVMTDDGDDVCVLGESSVNVYSVCMCIESHNSNQLKDV